VAHHGGTLAPLPEPDLRPAKPETNSVNHFPKNMVSELSWAHSYDKLGQVTTGWHYTNGSTLISGRDFGYRFDDIGNRLNTTNNSTVTNYSANLLNQYTAIAGVSHTSDDDGNETGDGTWTRTWDGENRLKSAETSTQKLEFAYDYMGRRIQKKVYSGSPGSWTLTTDYRFIYDGWNLMAIVDSTLAVFRAYVWGLDLSGSLQGAGGVGGLLVATGSGINPQFYCYDGNGNVLVLLRATDGKETARYEYGPFGETLLATGIRSGDNPFRFSTKFCDTETGQLYYGYRFYNGSVGRWLSRDPLYEEGTDLWRAGGAEDSRSSLFSNNARLGADLFNLHLFVRNAPMANYDPTGTGVFCSCTPPTVGLGLPLTAPLCGTLFPPPLFAPFGSTVTAGPATGTCSLNAWVIVLVPTKWCPTCVMVAPCTYTRTYTCVAGGPGAVIGSWVPAAPILTGGSCLP
jgi:RHS repeat-associated protein